MEDYRDNTIELLKGALGSANEELAKDDKLYERMAEQIRVLRETLEKVQMHINGDTAYSKGCRRRIIDALASTTPVAKTALHVANLGKPAPDVLRPINTSTAPVAETGQKEGDGWCGEIIGDGILCAFQRGHEGPHGYFTQSTLRGGSK